MIEVSIWIKLLKNALKATIPDRDVLTHEEHPKLDYAMLLVRNNLVGAAAVLFIISFFVDEHYHIFKGVGYFSVRRLMCLSAFYSPIVLKRKFRIRKCLWYIALARCI